MFGWCSAPSHRLARERSYHSMQAIDENYGLLQLPHLLLDEIANAVSEIVVARAQVAIKAVTLL